MLQFFEVLSKDDVAAVVLLQIFQCLVS